MQIAIIHLQDTISFTSAPDASKFAPFKSLNNLQLINPVYYEAPLVSYAISDNRMPIPLRPDSWLILTDKLCIALDDNRTPDLDEIKMLLRALRYTSGQSTVPLRTSIIHINPLPPEFLVEARARRPASGTRGFVTGRLVDLAMPWSQIESVDKLISTKGFEVYREILLDAISARYADDHAKSILYAAIACEAVASTRLEQTYETLRASPPSGQSHRFIQYTTHEGCFFKDPIFEMISKPDRRRFLTIIHEASLYLLGRSIQSEMPEVYRTAQTLYNTRNKLAHTGKVETNPDKTLPVSDGGCLQALRCATEIFEWYGVPAKSLIPREGLVPVGTDASGSP